MWYLLVSTPAGHYNPLTGLLDGVTLADALPFAHDHPGNIVVNRQQGEVIALSGRYPGIDQQVAQLLAMTGQTQGLHAVAAPAGAQGQACLLWQRQGDG